MDSKKQIKTIDKYIKAFPADVQKRLEKIRQTIRKAAPGAQETISYQIPAFKLNGNLVHFGAFKNHIGLFPRTSAITAFKKDLAPYKVTKGTLQFPVDKPIPFDLIRKIVVFRVRENSKKKT